MSSVAYLYDHPRSHVACDRCRCIGKLRGAGLPDPEDTVYRLVTYFRGDIQVVSRQVDVMLLWNGEGVRDPVGHLFSVLGKMRK